MREASGCGRLVVQEASGPERLRETSGCFFKIL